MDDPGPVKELIANVNGLMVSGGVDHRGHIESRLLIRTLAALKLQGTIMDPKKKVDDINGQKKKNHILKLWNPMLIQYWVSHNQNVSGILDFPGAATSNYSGDRYLYHFIAFSLRLHLS